jgi:hypothetical protein
METRSKAINKKLVPVVEKKVEEAQLTNVNCEIVTDIKQRFNAIKLKQEELLKLQNSLSLSEEVKMFRSKYFKNKNIFNTNAFCSCALKNKSSFLVEWNPDPPSYGSNTVRTTSFSHCEKCNRFNMSDFECGIW